MAGFLSGVFDGGNQSAENAQQAGAHDALDLDASLTVSDSESFQFEDMNDTTHDVSNEQDVTIDLSAHAVLAVAADTSQGAFTGDGFEE